MRNRSGVIPRAMTVQQIRAARPGIKPWEATERASRMRDRQVSAFMRLYGDRPFIISLPHGSKEVYYAIVHQETAQGPNQYEWRVTYFDADGPMGHGYGSNWSKKGDAPGGYAGILRRLVREDAADLRLARFEG